MRFKNLVGAQRFRPLNVEQRRFYSLISQNTKPNFLNHGL